MFDNVDIKKFTRRFYEIYGELYDSGFSDFGETNRTFTCQWMGLIMNFDIDPVAQLLGDGNEYQNILKGRF